MQAGNWGSPAGNASSIAVPAPQGESGWAGKMEAFEKRHLQLILGLQGSLDIMAGPATMATSITIALALAPETGGLSLLLAGAALTYGITRGGVQTAAGMSELTAAAIGNKEQEKSVKEDMDHVKTLTSISGFLILGTQETKHGKITKEDWTRAGFASDAETFITGRGADRAYEAASETVRISSRITSVTRWGSRADKTDQIHSASKDTLSMSDWAQRVINQQNRDRKRKSMPPPASHPNP